MPPQVDSGRGRGRGGRTATAGRGRGRGAGHTPHSPTPATSSTPPPSSTPTPSDDQTHGHTSLAPPGEQATTLERSKLLREVASAVRTFEDEPDRALRDWCLHVDDMFDCHKVAEDLKLDVVLMRLHGPAAAYYRLLRSKPETTPATWEDLKKALLDYYHPLDHYIEARNTLRRVVQAGQGKGTVAKYFQRFSNAIVELELSERDKVVEFLAGLHPHVLERMRASSTQPFREVLQDAIRIDTSRRSLIDSRPTEDCDNDASHRRKREYFGPYSFEDDDYDNHPGDIRDHSPGPDDGSDRRDDSYRPRADGPNTGRAAAEGVTPAVVCWRCNKPGHFARECRSKKHSNNAHGYPNAPPAKFQRNSGPAQHTNHQMAAIYHGPDAAGAPSTGAAEAGNAIPLWHTTGIDFTPATRD